MSPDDVTLGELGRRLDAYQRDTNRRLDEVNANVNARTTAVSDQIRSLSFVPRGEYEAERAAFERRIADIEEGKKWQIRTVAAAIVIPILMMVVMGYLNLASAR